MMYSLQYMSIHVSIFQISMSVYPTMEIVHKLVPTPMEATSAHVDLVML